MTPVDSCAARPEAGNLRVSPGVVVARKFGIGVFAVVISWAPQLRAQTEPSPTQIFAGVDTGFSSYAYVGGGVPLIDGFGLRASAFAGTYQYESGALGRVDARFAGAEAELLYQYKTNNTWIDAGAGVRDIDTDLKPYDPGNRRHGDQAEPVVVLDGGHVSGPWRVDAYGSYGTRLDDYLVRGSLTHTVVGPWRLGVEASSDGDPTYKEQRVGPLAGVRFGPWSEVVLSTGVAYQTGRGDGAYLRIGFNHSF